MKFKHSIIFMALLAITSMFASCSEGEYWDEYDAEGKITYSFEQAYRNYSVSPAEVPSEVVLQIYRNTTLGNETLPVTLSANTPELSGPASVTFNEGSNVAEYIVSVGSLEIGAQNKATISFAEESVSPSGNMSCAVTIVVNYDWAEWATGTFVDQFMGCSVNVPIMKAEGATVYRIMQPYKELMLSEDYGYSESDWAKFSCPYIEFKTEGSAVKFNTFLVDTYDGSTDNLIYGFWPSDLNASLADYEQYSKVVDNTTVQLAPYYYVPGLGGWGVYPVTFTLDSGYNF